MLNDIIMITSLKIGDKIVLKQPTNIFEEMGVPKTLNFNEIYTVDQLVNSIVDNSIIRVGLKEEPYQIYYIGLFETSLKFERKQKLNNLKKYETN